MTHIKPGDLTVTRRVRSVDLQTRPPWRTDPQGLPVFLHDGDVAIGAVHGMSGNDLIIIENAGDFTLPRSVVQDVHEHR